MKNPFVPSAAARACSVALLALAQVGCASFSPDGGFGKVAELTRQRTGQTASWQRSPADVDAAQARVAELLAQPLNADRAVELALLNNRGLQASFAELGIAESELVRVGRLPNPSLAFAHLRGGGVTEIDRSMLFNVLALLTLPAAHEVEQQRFEQTQYQAALDAVQVAAQARRAFYSAVAAGELATYAVQVKDAADASGELARRMLQAGNFNRLAQLRQQAFQADASAQLVRAQHQAVVERERLTRLLGLQGDQLKFRLPERLPDLPDAPAEAQDAEQAALDQRLDVLIAKRSAQATAQQLGLTNATRFVNVLELGYANKSQTGEAGRSGYQIELELPLFDFGSVRNARAEAVYMRSVQHAAEVAINARSQVRESYAAYRSSYELARHCRDEVLPLRKRISDENLLRYNGMLIGVFELLADAREQVASVTTCVEALRDHWLAQSQLQAALTGGDTEPSKASR
ncbi:MAG TPA: TolC family protein [Burkholderiaceae bacterium]|nr:TolC family protein [Burkholderiaceae bacterium]